MKINHFYAHLRRLALKTFKNIQRTPTTTHYDDLEVLRGKYVKPESSAVANIGSTGLCSNLKLRNYLTFLKTYKRVWKKHLERQHTYDRKFLYAIMPPHLKKSINQAYLESCTYEQIVRHLEQ